MSSNRNGDRFGPPPGAGNIPAEVFNQINEAELSDLAEQAGATPTDQSNAFSFRCLYCCILCSKASKSSDNPRVLNLYFVPLVMFFTPVMIPLLLRQ